MRFVAQSLLLAATLAFAPSAYAQGEEAKPEAAAEEEDVSDADKARAAKLFEEGRQLMAENDIAGACKKFAESQKVRAGIGTLYNLADCNERLGKTGTAFKLFTEVAERTKAALQTEREQKARERLSALEPKLMRIRLSVPAGGKVKAVKLDGAVVASNNYNKALPADPGDHTIVATTANDNGEPFEEEIELSEEGKTVTVAIPVASGAKMKRRVPMIIGGGVTAGIGLIFLGGAGFVFSQGDADEVGAGLAVLGIVHLAVGLPIFGVGFKKKPVRDAMLDNTPVFEPSPIPEVGIGPTGGSLTWRF
ncbi:MAG: hypothetical protein JNK04_01125 [Myxococcales bacterium]|nr:hypothetical protein [Myxococcales bacterium]